jgi:hypothetical protein
MLSISACVSFIFGFSSSHASTMIHFTFFHISCQISWLHLHLHPYLCSKAKPSHIPLPSHHMPPINSIIQLPRPPTSNSIQILIALQAPSLHRLPWSHRRTTSRTIPPASRTTTRTPASRSRRRAQPAVLTVPLVWVSDRTGLRGRYSGTVCRRDGWGLRRGCRRSRAGRRW